MSLLTVNVGSSSVKLEAYAEDGRRLAERQLVQGSAAVDDPAHAPKALRAFAAESGSEVIRAIVHRVVHGGEKLRSACIIDAAVEAEIDRLGELAPLHNPPALAWIRAARTGLPGTAQIAVFDTAFFVALPTQARRYAIPASWARADALRRYGFHGLAHEFLWQRWTELQSGCAPKEVGGRVISLQLGSGCSIAAVRDGHPLDTSMGFSPLEGLVMGTRCGDLDPGLVLYLQRQWGWSAQQLEERLNHECGLLGLSGLSADVQVLLGAQAKAQAKAQAIVQAKVQSKVQAKVEADSVPLALEIYCYRVRKYIGAYLAVLGGADAILFGGGVGEHAASLRARMLAGFEWAGIVLDEARNAAASGIDARIGADTSAVDVRVLVVDESAMMLRQARAVLAGAVRTG